MAWHLFVLRSYHHLVLIDTDHLQCWAIGTWDQSSGILVLPEVNTVHRLLKYRPF